MALDLLNNLDDFSNVKVYYAVRNGTSNGIQIWEKPRGISSLYVVCIGPGGGGGGAYQGANVNNRGGGGGGGCGAITRVMVPAYSIPSRLFINVGTGGAGGTGGTSATPGGTGTVTRVYTRYAASIGTGEVLCQASSGGGGGAGTNAVGGSAGTAAGSAGATAMVAAMYGTFISQVGVVGTGGGFGNTAPTNVSQFSSSLLTPGPGGAGCFSSSSQGGTVNPTTIFVSDNFSTGILSTGANGKNAPLFLFNNRLPLMSISGGGGGSGGGSTGQGGNGGNGNIGSGGGGGGAGVGAGAGGRGGDGMVIIVSI